MSTRDLLLAGLYNTPRDPAELEIAAKHAPILLFDEREPFQPLAAGYTLFSEDGPSLSFERSIRLCPEGKEPAALAIEYAIWWDWDIHHLYELEHIWVYLDRANHPIRVEGSWHGGYHELPLMLEGPHPILLSEPGKHAFATVSSRFRRRIKESRRSQTRLPGFYAEVLVKDMFAETIHKQIFDDTLVRSYLVRQGFDPAWKFSKRFTFQSEWLVPWPALFDWIPQRMLAWLERLQITIQPADYRPLCLAAIDGTLEGLQSAARAGAEIVFFSVRAQAGRLVIASPHEPPLDIKTAFAFCKSEPMRAMLEPASAEAVESLPAVMRSRRARQFSMITSPYADWLKRYRELVPDAVTAIQLADPALDPLQAAGNSGAQYIHLRWEHLENPLGQIQRTWVERVHQAGLGLISWPVGSESELKEISQQGFDIVWQNFHLENRTGSQTAETTI